jgi:type IV pilus assembly protein PilC
VRLKPCLIALPPTKEKTESLKLKVKKALKYPIVVVGVAIIITVILLLKVVPTFKELFEGFGAELPAATQFVVDMSEAVQEDGLMIAGIIVAIVYGLNTWRELQIPLLIRWIKPF